MNILTLIITSLQIKLFVSQSNVWPWHNPCNSSKVSSLPFCDTSKSFEERAHDLVYNQESKVGNINQVYAGLTGNTATDIPDLNIPKYQWWNEALHGIANSLGVNFNGPIKAATVFPEPILTASSFNNTLFRLIGDAISTEGRAMFNSNQCGLTFWSPNINIFRDPRWGRGQETPGEDPVLSTNYAIGFVNGMQGNGSSKYLKLSACIKHGVDYSMENSDGVTRDTFNAIVSEYDQTNTYYPVFKSAAQYASCFMCSYNAENGVPSCANSDFMTSNMRNAWKFNGYITSDCGAVYDVMEYHHYTSGPFDTCNAVFSAGMDTNCGQNTMDSFTQQNAAGAVSGGQLKLSVLQNAVYHLTLVQMRLGMFDDPSLNPYSKLGPNDVCTNSSLQLSLQAAREGIVLLKNGKNNDTLPIDASNISSVNVQGQYATDSVVMLGNYYGNPLFSINAMDGIKMYVSNTNGASNAPLTVIYMGLDQSDESEGHDRDDLNLPDGQDGTIQSVASTAKQTSGNIVILVILSGGCVDISKWRDSDLIDVIIWAGYPGMYGGLAIADIIFGTFSPTGKLTQTWYYNDYCSEIKMIDMNMRPNTSTVSPGRGYRYYTGKTVFNFGDGMSYTKFQCNIDTLDLDNNNNNNNGVIMVNITNIGKYDSGAVVLLFYIPCNTTESQYVKKLVGYERIDMIKSTREGKLKITLDQVFYQSKEYEQFDGKFVLGGDCRD